MWVRSLFSGDSSVGSMQFDSLGHLLFPSANDNVAASGAPPIILRTNGVQDHQISG